MSDQGRQVDAVQGPDATRTPPDPSIERFSAELESARAARAAKVRRLVEAYDRLGETYEFAPGQLVQWKDGLQNKNEPPYGEPAIVVAVLAEPIHDKEQSGGSAYFREPLDLILGLTGPDGTLVTYHFDKRRFEPYLGPS
jgi:hypothetical protein